MTTIFVSLAAYRDAELPYTIDSLVKNSTHDLTISVVEQCNRNERIDMSKWASDRVKFTGQWMRSGNAKGAGYARNLAMSYYTNEDFFFQIDSHTLLVQNWDSKMIETLNAARNLAGTDKVLLSQFPAGYERNGEGVTLLTDHPKYPNTTNRQYPKVNKQGAIIGQRGEEINELTESTTLLAGYIFAPGEFTKLGYESEISFMGEEFVMAIKAWLAGWRIYSPAQMFMWHHYGRRGRGRVWKDITKWPLIEYNSHKRQTEIFKGYQSDQGDWNRLHQDHRDTILAYLKIEGLRANECYVEQDVLNNIKLTVINGKPYIQTL